MAKKANVEKYVAEIAEGNALNEQYKQYESVYVHRAHKELYALLTEIMRYATDILNSAEKQAAIQAIRKTLKDQYGIKVSAATGELGTLLRFALRDAHKKTRFIYKRAIQLALDAGICANDFAAFIERSGGIDKLSKSTEAKALAEASNKDLELKNYRAYYYLHACAQKRVYGHFVVDKQYEHYEHDEQGIGDFKYAICKRNGSGYDVVGFANMNNETEGRLQREFHDYNLKYYKDERKADKRELFKLANKLYKDHMQAIHGITNDVKELIES